MKILALMFTVVAVAAVVPARAQVLRPIDLNKRADEFNGKVINPSTLSLEVLPATTTEFQRSTLSDQLHGAGPVDQPRYDARTVELPITTQPIVPQVNFAAKRAAQSDSVRPGPRVESRRAPLNQRDIRALTPAGEEELKKVLNSTP
jgi:hypothetical protein